MAQNLDFKAILSLTYNCVSLINRANPANLLGKTGGKHPGNNQQ